MLAEGEHIGVFGHGDAKADRRRAVESEHWLLRVDVGAADFGDIAQAKETAVGAEIDRVEIFFRRELSRNADSDLFRSGVDGAAGLDRVLCLQRRYEAGNVEAHGG